MPKKISAMELLKESWEILKTKWQLFMPFIGVFVGLQIVLSILGNYSKEGGAFSALAYLVIQVANFVVQIGFLRATILIVRGEKPELETMWQVKEYIVPYLLAGIFVGLKVLLGFLLLIVPGVIWSIQYMFVPYIVVDKKLAAAEAMDLSTKLTNGVKWDLFILGVILTIISMVVALLTLGIGLIVLIPVMSLAGFVLYERRLKAIGNA